jgi:hypothetical protein
MKKFPQLTHLIFNYYREDLEELRALQPLLYCSLSRRWGTFIITCPNQETYAALLRVQDILGAPLSKLRLAKKVRLSIKDSSEVKSFFVTPSKGDLWKQELKRVRPCR